jgi:putative FmdB family regulatory protein
LICGEEKRPLYDYECQNCGKVFTVALSLKEHEGGESRRPGCNSKDVRQTVSHFEAKTSKKS